MADNHFQDHFSAQADLYQQYRPYYPQELFRYLSNLVPRHKLAWDCATGSGQAACALSPFFESVLATDASVSQIENATPHDRVEYQVSPAEATAIPANSVDLITVAQALHWFNLDKFYVEVKRVLTSHGVLAVWTYNLFSINKKIDTVIHKLYFDVLGTYWPTSRRLVESGYRDLLFPFNEIEVPKFSMCAHWTLQHLMGYLSTWSAVQEYQRTQHYDPIDLIAAELQMAWGDAAESKLVQWPLSFKVGRLYQ